MNKVTRKSILFTLVLIVVLILLPMVSVSAQNTERGSVLLLWDSSNFKDILVDEIEIAAEEAGWDLTVEDSVGELKKVNLDNYSGLIIINTGMAGRMKRVVRDTLENPNDLPRTVVVTTFGNPSKSRDENPNNPVVDAITSASLKNTDEIRSLAADIVALLVD